MKNLSLLSLALLVSAPALGYEQSTLDYFLKNKKLPTQLPMGQRVGLTTAMTLSNLSNADLSNKNLSGANLAGAILSGANLTNSNLTNANLSKANLSGANLSKTNLTKANLSETLFRFDASLSKANLYKADFERSKIIPMRTIYKKGEKHADIMYPSVTKAWLKEKGALNVDSLNIK